MSDFVAAAGFWFQSHAGSIEAVEQIVIVFVSIVFQSHAGSIEAWRPRRVSTAPSGFNPTLVRLRPTPSASNKPFLIRSFNPTLVRLRHPDSRGQKRVAAMFQSHAGSIEALDGRTSIVVHKRVSIPRWFD